MNILVTGGAGYIGSHVVLLLKEAGHTTIVYDDLSKGHKSHIFSHHFVEGSLHDTPRLKESLQKYRVDAVMHFAAFIESGESMSDPDRYFYNNTEGSLSLLRAMRESEVKQLIFSSTAALYGFPEEIPIPESSPLNPVNPYGESKLLVERILSWYSKLYGLRYVSLRYFNAAGADPELRTGELHNPETHLIPLALQTAYGEREKIFINGTDYSTPDGTCIRDYIHVTDLARAHLLSLEYLRDGGESQQFNLGSQKGYSVREVLDTVRRVTGKSLRIEEGPRRPGDPEILVASSEKIVRILGWKPRFGSLEEIIGTADAFYRKHRGL